MTNLQNGIITLYLFRVNSTIFVIFTAKRDEMKAHIYDYVLAKYNHFLVVRYMFNIYDNDFNTRWCLQSAKSVKLLTNEPLSKSEIFLFPSNLMVNKT